MVRVNFVEPPPRGDFGDRYRVEARIVSGRQRFTGSTGALFRRGGDWMTTDRKRQGTASEAEIGHNNGVGAEVRGGVAEGSEDGIPDAVRERPVQSR